MGGAVLFETLGAMIGGRAKQKKIRTIEDYFIITYQKDGAADYISFKIHGGTNKYTANFLINYFNSNYASEKKIEL